MMLQTQNLCKYFKKQKAVNNVSLNIEKGQIYGLLGPNGAGKSTTLKMLTGMMKPTAGKIYFDGKLLDRKDLSKIGHDTLRKYETGENEPALSQLKLIANHYHVNVIPNFLMLGNT